MDAKQIGQFIVTHRFWFLLSLALIFAWQIDFLGSSALKSKTIAAKALLDSTYKKIEGYTVGDHPNAKFIDAATAKTDEATKQVNEAWEKLYLKQEPLMKWPTQVEAKFKGRAFGDKLDDDQGKFLFEYRRNYFEEQMLQLWLDLNPLDRENDRVVGVVDAPQGLILSKAANWEAGEPTSQEAWVAQEHIWIIRALVNGIYNANGKATDWKSARIKRINAMAIGSAGIDSFTATKNPTLIDALADPGAAPDPNAAFGGTAGNKNLFPLRYLVKNEKFRIIPIYLNLWIDQMEIPNVLAVLSQADFYLTINEVNISKPTKAEIPAIIKADSRPGQTTLADTSVSDIEEVEIRGTMRIYEMPPSLKEKRAAKPADAGATPPATPTP